MARILLLTLVFAPDGVSNSILMAELALELRDLGHEVTVLTTTPHYNVEPEARAEQPLRPRWGCLLYESSYYGIPVFHAAIPLKGQRILARILDYLRFHIVSTLAGLLLVHRLDVIFAPSPPLTIGLSAWLLALIRRVPYIYNVQEIYPDIAVKLGVLRSTPLIWLVHQVERFIYARARSVVVISDWFSQKLTTRVAPHKLVTIPNFVDTDFVAPGDRQNTFSIANTLVNQFVVLYAGNIGLTQGFETILDAAARLVHHPEVLFLIIGDGSRRTWLEAQIEGSAVGNIRLLPYQPRSAVPLIYASSDVCLVPLKSGTAQETFPSKIYSIMAAGRAAIAASDANSELNWLIQESGCGWVIPPDDAAQLADAIEHALLHRSETAQRGQRGRDHVVAHYSRRAVVCQYDRLIRSLVEHS